MKHSWDRLKDEKESPKAHNAFCAYRSIPACNRTLKETTIQIWVQKEMALNNFKRPEEVDMSQAPKTASKSVCRWNERFIWPDRAADYWEHLNKERDKMRAEIEADVLNKCWASLQRGIEMYSPEKAENFKEGLSSIKETRQIIEMMKTSHIQGSLDLSLPFPQSVYEEKK